MGCTETVLAMAGIALLAIAAGLGMILRPLDVLAVGGWYFSRVERKMGEGEEREKVQQMRQRMDARTREVRICGVFYLLLSLPFLVALGQVGPAFLAGRLPGC